MITQKHMKAGVLLINLGTPDSPSTKDVRKYLREFLIDPYVIDLPWLKRWLLVNLIIAPFRGPKSAKLYQEIWTDEGSPLLIHGIAVKRKLQEKLGEQYVVELAMRYQNPSIESVLKRMSTMNLNDIVVIPLYPQYASSSTASTIAKVNEISKTLPSLPPLNFINSFYDHPTFINAWVEQLRKHDITSFDHVIFSFHGLPERHLLKEHPSGDCTKHKCLTEINEANKSCYRAQCYATVRGILEQTPIPDKDFTISFQSRLGSDPWIQPFSDEVVKQKAQGGCKNLLILSPAFVADCLETLCEIQVEYEELFKEYGGQQITLVKSLNSETTWISALEEMAKSAISSS